VEYAAKEAVHYEGIHGCWKAEAFDQRSILSLPFNQGRSDSAKVTLENLKDQYFLVKYCVVECLNRQIPSIE